MGNLNLQLLIDSYDKEHFTAAKKKIMNSYLNTIKKYNGKYSPARTILDSLFNENQIDMVTYNDLGNVLTSTFKDVTHNSKCVSKYFLILRELFVDENDGKIHCFDKRTLKYYDFLESEFFVLEYKENEILLKKSDEEILDYITDYLRILFAMYGNREVVSIDGNNTYGIKKMDFNLTIDIVTKFTNEILDINKKKFISAVDRQSQMEEIQLVFASLFTWLVFYRIIQNESIDLINLV